MFNKKGGRLQRRRAISNPACHKGNGCAVDLYILLLNIEIAHGGKTGMVLKKREDGWKKMLEGVERQNLVHGDKTHLLKFRLHKDAVIPIHDHPHEQTGYLLQGKMVMIIEDEECRLESGDSWSLRGGVHHGVKVLEECLVLEVFSPVREEYFDEEIRL
jgi:quercetin dioxygenase-like cupin family protein